jgi:hypothetical protein
MHVLPGPSASPRMPMIGRRRSRGRRNSNNYRVGPESDSSDSESESGDSESNHGNPANPGAEGNDNREDNTNINTTDPNTKQKKKRRRKFRRFRRHFPEFFLPEDRELLRKKVDVLRTGNFYENFNGVVAEYTLRKLFPSTVE